MRRVITIEYMSTLTLWRVVDVNVFEFLSVLCSLGTNCDVAADSVTNLSLVGFIAIDNSFV